MDAWDWTYPLFFIGFLIAGFIPTWAMRKKNSREIYIIWYIFSFSFLLFFGLHIAAWAHNYHLTQMCGSYEGMCKAIYGSLTAVEDELYLLAAVTGVILGPQLLTYVLSGIFGAAHAPKFVEQIRKFVVWSYIKFNACLSGIQAASGLSRLFSQNAVAWSDLILAAMWLAVAFSYAFVEGLEKAPSSAIEKRAYQWLHRVHKFFTRNVRDEYPHPLDKINDPVQDSALPEI